MKEWNGKTVKKWHSAMDRNGNKVAKIFYEDETTEIVRSPSHGQAISIISHCLDCMGVCREM